MIKITDAEVHGWEPSIRGMRNPMNSWAKSDSDWMVGEDPVTGMPETFFKLGPNDADLMCRLNKSGSDHRKFMRMLVVYADITAPLYWWKEYDTYKVGTVANSCSTMHKIHAKEFTFDDFSIEHLDQFNFNLFKMIIANLNAARKHFIESNDKDCWWQMIQLLPTSYNQKRTVEFNYEVLRNMYHSRKNHKLDEWRIFCNWIESLPYSWLITGKEPENGET